MEYPETYTSNGLLAIMDALPMAIVVIDKDIRVVLANRAVQEYTNKNNEFLIGRVGGVAFACIHRNDSPEGCGFGPDCDSCNLRNIVIETMETGKAHKQVEATMAFEAKGERHLRVSTSPVTLNSETMVLLALEDLTEIKQHEKVQLEKEKLSAVVETAGAVCHEFNQPLQIITGFCDILKENASLDPDNERIISMILDAAVKMGDLNRKLMNITKYKTKPYMESTIIDIAQASDS